MTIKYDQAYEYAKAVVDGTLSADWIESGDADSFAPRYVKAQCIDFIEMWEGRNDRYCVDTKKLIKVCKLLKAMKMAKGWMSGKSVYDSLAGFQWFIIAALICCVRRDDKHKRRYTKALLEICRKNGKTFVVALLFVILFYTEPQFSRMFSVAPDGALAKEIKEALEPLLVVNDELFEHNFKVTRDYILHKERHTRYTPLNYSNNRMDGREPNVWIADEIGALPTNYPMEAMESGQLLLENPLGFEISTKYPTIDNPLEDEVAYAKRILDGIEQDESFFALLYEPDKPEAWAIEDTVLIQGNPIVFSSEAVYKSLLKKRSKAIARESLRENFLTKHCNIIYQGVGTESYIPIEFITAASVESADFSDKELYVGVDLAMTNDNCAVAWCYEDDGVIYADVKAFIPEDRIDEKSEFERIDYRARVAAGDCIACGDMTVDYSVIENYVENIERTFGGRIVSIGYDRYNALSSAQKWENEGYTTVEIRQHSSVLHPPTKLLAEKAMSGELKLVSNKLLEVNFQNAQCTYDTNMNRYVNKKKSNGKVDMVVALINAVYLLQQDVLFGSDFVCQY